MDRANLLKGIASFNTKKLNKIPEKTDEQKANVKPDNSLQPSNTHVQAENKSNPHLEIKTPQKSLTASAKEVVEQPSNIPYTITVTPTRIIQRIPTYTEDEFKEESKTPINKLSSHRIAYTVTPNGKVNGRAEIVELETKETNEEKLKKASIAAEQKELLRKQQEKQTTLFDGYCSIKEFNDIVSQVKDVLANKDTARIETLNSKAEFLLEKIEMHEGFSAEFLIFLKNKWDTETECNDPEVEAYFLQFTFKQLPEDAAKQYLANLRELLQLDDDINLENFTEERSKYLIADQIEHIIKKNKNNEDFIFSSLLQKKIAPYIFKIYETCKSGKKSFLQERFKAAYEFLLNFENGKYQVPIKIIASENEEQDSTIEIQESTKKEIKDISSATTSLNSALAVIKGFWDDVKSELPSKIDTEIKKEEFTRQFLIKGLARRNIKIPEIEQKESSTESNLKSTIIYRSRYDRKLPQAASTIAHIITEYPALISKDVLKAIVNNPLFIRDITTLTSDSISLCVEKYPQIISENIRIGDVASVYRKVNSKILLHLEKIFYKLLNDELNENEYTSLKVKGVIKVFIDLLDFLVIDQIKEQDKRQDIVQKLNEHFIDLFRKKFKQDISFQENMFSMARASLKYALKAIPEQELARSASKELKITRERQVQEDNDKAEFTKSSKTQLEIDLEAEIKKEKEKEKKKEEVSKSTTSSVTIKDEEKKTEEIKTEAKATENKSVDKNAHKILLQKQVQEKYLLNTNFYRTILDNRESIKRCTEIIKQLNKSLAELSPDNGNIDISNFEIYKLYTVEAICQKLVPIAFILTQAPERQHFIDKIAEIEKYEHIRTQLEQAKLAKEKNLFMRKNISSEDEKFLMFFNEFQSFFFQAASNIVAGGDINKADRIRINSDFIPRLQEFYPVPEQYKRQVEIIENQIVFLTKQKITISDDGKIFIQNLQNANRSLTDNNTVLSTELGQKKSELGEIAGLITEFVKDVMKALEPNSAIIPGKEEIQGEIDKLEYRNKKLETFLEDLKTSLITDDYESMETLLEVIRSGIIEDNIFVFPADPIKDIEAMLLGPVVLEESVLDIHKLENKKSLLKEHNIKLESYFAKLKSALNTDDFDRINPCIEELRTFPIKLVTHETTKDKTVSKPDDGLDILTSPATSSNKFTSKLTTGTLSRH